MGYINSNTGYPSHTLSSRSVIKKNMYAVITPDGLVKNNIYGYEYCDISILSSPLLGASFVDYTITVKKRRQKYKRYRSEWGRSIFICYRRNV